MKAGDYCPHMSVGYWVSYAEVTWFLFLNTLQVKLTDGKVFQC